MYDLIIIGAGTAGISAYKEAIKHTNNLLIINAGPWDTTCARVGCMPSKILISSANRMYDIMHAHDLGLQHDAQINTANVMPRVRALRDRFTQATIKDVNSWPTEHKISGHAKFLNSNTIEVNGQQYQAKSFIIAIGSYPNVDQSTKLELGDRIITSDDIFELPNLPKSLAVIGSGVIAIELAQAMSRLSVEVTVFARSKKVGSLTSPHLQELAQQELSKELNFKFKILPEQIKLKGNLVEISYTENEKHQILNVDYLLTATGRTSYLNQLSLENIDATFKDIKALPLNDETKQLANYPIFIIGDAATKTPIQHEAAHAGRTIIKNALNFPEINPIPKLTSLGIMFSQPEMASVGLNYKNLTEQKIEFITGYVSYEKQGRAVVQAENKGAVELYVDRTTHKLLGAELFSPQAEHLAHLLAWIIDEDLDIHQILNKPFYHPVVEEGLRTALKHARRQLN